MFSLNNWKTSSLSCYRFIVLLFGQTSTVLANTCTCLFCASTVRSLCKLIYTSEWLLLPALQRYGVVQLTCFRWSSWGLTELCRLGPEAILHCIILTFIQTEKDWKLCLGAGDPFVLCLGHCACIYCRNEISSDGIEML